MLTNEFRKKKKKKLEEKKSTYKLDCLVQTHVFQGLPVHLLDPSGLMGYLRHSVSLLILCLDDLSVHISGGLKFLFVLLSFSPFRSVSICLIYFSASNVWHIYQYSIFLLDWPLYHYLLPLFIFYYYLCFSLFCPKWV